MNINAALIAESIVFGLLCLFFVNYIWPPIAKALDERADKIAEGLAAAERGKSDFEQAEKKISTLLGEGRNQVSEILANAEKRAAQIIEDAKVQAEKEAVQITEQARTNAEQEISRAREALREQVAFLAVKGAESILRREVDEKQHAQMLGALKQEL